MRSILIKELQQSFALLKFFAFVVSLFFFCSLIQTGTLLRFWVEMCHFWEASRPVVVSPIFWNIYSLFALPL